MTDTPDDGRDHRKFRRMHQGDLERVVRHFMYYLSNEPGKDGISPRFRFYGMLPIEAKLLFPDVPDEVFTKAVIENIAVLSRQHDILPR